MEIKRTDGTVTTDEMLDAMAAEYENGSWEGHGEITMGRPHTF